MNLRARPTHWFETYVPRAQTVYALEALAATGRVELEKGYVERALPDTQALRRAVNEGHALIERYPRLLPSAKAARPVFAAEPTEQALVALTIVRHYAASLLRLQRRYREIGRRLHQLRLLQRCLHAMGPAAEELVRFHGSGNFLCHAVFACPADIPGPFAGELPGSSEQFSDADYRFHTVLCLPEERHFHLEAFSGSQCEPLDIPAWVVDDWPHRDYQIQHEIHRLQARRRSITNAIRKLRADNRLTSALGELAVLDWYIQRTMLLSEDHRFCYVTGWTSAADPAGLQDALDRAHIDAKIVFRPMPPGNPPPVDLADTRWLHPFRQFVRMFGTPAPGEVDPTPLVAVLIPILFGFMFADIGHGLVLVAASLALWQRHPQTRFLLTCGLSATAFGLLFGEFFGLQGAIPALLPSPLDEPLTVLLASIGFGALVLLLGLALSALGAAWRQELRRWLWQDAAVLVLYASAMLAIVQPLALLVTGLALAWYLAGVGVTGQRLAPALGRLTHSTLELALNTLSFARVGAFSLAHAALTHAVIDIATRAEPLPIEIGVFVVGQAVIIAIEGFAVYVQTLRLILFEFFTRFLRADGRLFRPSAPPAGNTA